MNESEMLSALCEVLKGLESIEEILLIENDCNKAFTKIRQIMGLIKPVIQINENEGLNELDRC